MDSPENRNEMLQAGTSWILEMELVNSPIFNNFMYLNIYNSSKHIKDTEYLVDRDDSVMLIWLKLGWWASLIGKKREISSHLLDEIGMVLPSFTCRVIFDRKLFELGLKRAKEKARRLLGEVGSDKANSKSDPDDSSNVTSESGSKGTEVLSEKSNILPDNEQQTKDKSEVRNETEQLDPQSEQETQDS